MRLVRLLSSSLILLAACGGATPPPAPAQPATVAPPVAAATATEPPIGVSFFVAKSRDGSARLGGVAGADALCREAATAAGAGDRTWRAYLSAAAEGGQPVVHARDRIGPGPWFNAKGALIARDLEELHSELHDISVRTALDARGERAQRAPHDLLTGSDETGRLAYEHGVPATCGNWTIDGEGVARIGHDDRMDADSFHNKRFARWNGSWNSEHPTLGCSAKRLGESGGGGGFYCFAADPRPSEIAAARAAAPDPARYTFARGVIVNHWLGYNFEQGTVANAGYGASWFDATGVAWIAEQGFDHVRIWVNGAEWVDSRGHLDEAKIARFDEVLAWARERRLGVVLAMYGVLGYRTRTTPNGPEDRAWTFADADNRDDAAYLWWMIARRYARVGGQLRFELLVSPEGAPDANALRELYAAMLDGIRRVDHARVVYLTPREASVANVSDVFFTDPNTALSLTFKEPEIFTYQFGDPKQLKVTFPGKLPELKGLPAGAVLRPEWTTRYAKTEWNDETLGKAIEALSTAASARAGRHEVYVSRFGVMRGVDDASARAYMKAARTAFESQGVGWAVYDYHTGGAVRDLRSGAPTRLVDGLGLK